MFVQRNFHIFAWQTCRHRKATDIDQRHSFITVTVIAILLARAVWRVYPEWGTEQSSESIPRGRHSYPLDYRCWHIVLQHEYSQLSALIKWNSSNFVISWFVLTIMDDIHNYLCAISLDFVYLCAISRDFVRLMIDWSVCCSIYKQMAFPWCVCACAIEDYSASWNLVGKLHTSVFRRCMILA